MKLALIIGINYTGTDNQLNGCINDANNVKNLLINNFGFKDDNIALLTDETEDKPTRNNILKYLYDLLTNCVDEDVDQVFFSYSGHGSYRQDKNGDEKDRKDELLVPLDLKIISDDELNCVFNLIQLHSKCFCLFDCCHSGTILDLPFCYRNTSEKFVKENRKVVNKLNSLIMISGCLDAEYSSEAWVGQVQGAMTTILIYILTMSNFKISWKKLVDEMNLQLKNYGFDQRPMLSCNHKLKLDENVEL